MQARFFNHRQLMRTLHYANFTNTLGVLATRRAFVTGSEPGLVEELAHTDGLPRLPEKLFTTDASPHFKRASSLNWRITRAPKPDAKISKRAAG